MSDMIALVATRLDIMWCRIPRAPELILYREALRLMQTKPVPAAADTESMHRTRFDVEALRSIAGEKTFARGEDYHRDGQVAILSIEPERVLARVSGTEDYRTVLTGCGKKIGGECSCPAFDDRGFCKHMVATALAANEADSDAETEGGGALVRIRRHLEAKGIDALVAMIVGIAERDADLFRRLDLAAATVDADDKTLEARLLKAIDGATRTSNYVGYGEAAGWAEGVDSVLDTIADLASGAHAGLVLRLVECAIDGIQGAIEEIDDSDGHCGGLLERASEIHLAAARVVRPDPVTFARELFVREVEGDDDTFHDVATRYAEVLGDAGRAEYRRLAAEAWDKLPPRTADTRARSEYGGNYDRLKAILDHFAEAEGDVEARVALRTKDLSSPWGYLQLVEFCRAHGREEEALRRAEEGLWLFEDDRVDERLLFLAVDLLAKAGRKDNAEAQLWRAFEKTPSFNVYVRLREVGGKEAGARAVNLLEARVAKEAPTRWHYPSDLLIGILMHDEMFERAWTVVRRHGASMHVRETLARASEGTHPREAIDTYAEQVEQFATAGGPYAEAVTLVARMAGLRSATEQAAYVAGLKTRFGRKRNLMKLLA